MTPLGRNECLYLREVIKNQHPELAPHTDRIVRVAKEELAKWDRVPTTGELKNFAQLLKEKHKEVEEKLTTEHIREALKKVLDEGDREHW